MIPMVSSAQSRSRNWCTSPRDRFGFASLDLPRLVLKVFFAVVQIIEKCFCCCGFGCKKKLEEKRAQGLINISLSFVLPQPLSSNCFFVFSLLYFLWLCIGQEKSCSNTADCGRKIWFVRPLFRTFVQSSLTTDGRHTTSHNEIFSINEKCTF